MKNYTFTTGFARLVVEAESWEKATEIAEGIWPMLKIREDDRR